MNFRKLCSYFCYLVCLLLLPFTLGCSHYTNEPPVNPSAFSDWKNKGDAWLLGQLAQNDSIPLEYDPSTETVKQEPLHPTVLLTYSYLISLASRDRTLSPILESKIVNQQNERAKIIEIFCSNHDPVASKAVHLAAAKIMLEHQILELKQMVNSSEQERFERKVQQFLTRAIRNNRVSDNRAPTSSPRRKSCPPGKLSTVVFSLAEIGAIPSPDLSSWLISAFSRSDSRTAPTDFLDVSDRYWIAKSINLVSESRPSPELAQIAFELADREVSRQSDDFFPGSFESDPSENSYISDLASDAQATSTILVAAKLAKLTHNKKRFSRYWKSALLAVKNLREHQYDAGEVEAFSKPALSIGAFRASFNAPEIRLDAVLYSLLALETAIELVDD